MSLTRTRVERDLERTLADREDVKNLLQQGSFSGIRKFAHLIYTCLEKLNAEAGLTGSGAIVITSTALQSSLPSMLLFREGEVRAASHAVATLYLTLSTGEPAEPVRIPQKFLTKWKNERELDDLVQMFPMAVFEETTAARKESSGKQILRRLMTCLDLSFDDIGRMLDVSGETIRRWERGVSRIPSETLANLEVADAALTRLIRLFLPQRLPEAVRRKADLFDGSRALDWILRGRITEVADRYEQTFTYQG